MTTQMWRQFIYFIAQTIIVLAYIAENCLLEKKITAKSSLSEQ